MNEKKEILKEYRCNICIKNYASHSSLCNHNKKFHKKKVQPNVLKVQHDVPKVQLNISNNNNTDTNKKIIKCEYCNKVFNARSTKSEHKKRSCKLNPNIDKNTDLIELKNKNTELIELKNKNIELEKKNNEISKSLIEIKDLLFNSKVHHKTLQKINKQLNNNTTNNITNNNVTINNTINLVGLGYENLSDVLSKKEKLNILKNMYGSLSKIVKYVHFNDKYPQFKTMLITNMQNNIAYKYDEDENRFLIIPKDELLDNLVSIRLDDIIAFNEEVGDKLDNNSKKKIDAFLDDIDDNEKLREIKKSELKIILYNNRNIVDKS